MSYQAFVDFYENYLNSPEGEALKEKIEAVQDGGEFCTTVAELGQAAGFDFSDEDVRQVMKASEMEAAKALAEASGELSDEQLDEVAGGASLNTKSSTDVPTVNISTSPTNYDVSSYSMRTAMCPW